MSVRITVYPNAAAFLERTLAWLETREVENGLITGLSLREAAQPAATSPSLFLSIEDDSDIIIAGLMNPGRNLLLTGNPIDPAADLGALAEEMFNRRQTPPGILAPPTIARGFVQAWSRLTGQSGVLKTHERCYKLVTVTPPPRPAGSMRLAAQADLETVSAWFYAFDEEAMDGGDPLEARARAELRITGQSMFLWDDDGPVAMAGKTRPTRYGCSVGPVYTPPEKRGCGYASALTASLSQAVLDEGFQYCSLFTDLSNPTANHIYQTIGYFPVADFDHYAIGL